MSEKKPVQGKRLRGTARGNPSAPCRGIKTIEPRCAVFEEMPNHPNGGEWQTAGVHETDWMPNWWVECEAAGHDPYFTHVEVKTRTPIIPEREDGRRIIEGYEESVEDVVTPRFRELKLPHQKAKAEYESARLKGWRRLEEVGYDPFCEYYQCWQQQNVRQYKNGTFCSDEHAQLVAAVENEENIWLAIDVGNDPEGKGARARARQLASTPV